MAELAVRSWLAVPMMSASDLSGLSCSPFCRYHCLTSAVHAASTDRPSDVLSENMGRRSCVSSAYWWNWTSWLMMTSAARLQYTANSRGPKADPWGTPTSSPTAGDLCWPSLTNCVRLSRYERNQDSGICHAKLGLETLEQDFVINCVEGGRQIETDEDSYLRVIGRSVTPSRISSSAVSLECPFRYADWYLLKLVDSSKWGRRRVNTSLSMLFETVDRLDMGL